MTLPFCLAYFGISYIVYKYQLLYVYEPSFESGGFFWYTIFDRSLTCLSWGIIALICYLGIRRTFYSGPFYFVLPLPIFISIFRDYCHSIFKDPSFVSFTKVLHFDILCMTLFCLSEIIIGECN